MISDGKKVQAIYFIYLCVFAVALFYRFYDLDKRSYFPNSDAPAYGGTIKTYRVAFDYIVGMKILKHDIGSMNDYLYENGVQFGTAAKDGIIPIGLIGSLIFGNGTNTILYTSAIFGVLTVLLLFFILSRKINLFYSSIIALLFAVSPYHVGFSREGLTVTFSSFFLLAAIYLYANFLKSNNFKYLALCGLFLGFGFLCHYNITPFILVFFTYELCHLLFKRNGIKRIAVLFVFIFLPLFLTDLSTRLIKLYGTGQGIKMIDKFYPYFNDLFRQLLIVKGGGSDIHAVPFYYFSNLLYHEGIISSLLLTIAVFLIIRRGIKADNEVGYFLISVFVLPFIYFLGMHSVNDRQMLSFIPVWYLIIGYGLNDSRRYKRIFAAFIIIAVFSSGLRSLDYFNYRSNFEQAVNYMERNKGIKHVTSIWSLSRLYVGRKNAVIHAEPPYSEKLTTLRKVVYQINSLSVDKIKSLYDDGYNYLLLNIPPSVSNELTDAAMDIEPEYSTDAMICNNRGDGYDPALLRDKKGKYLYHFNVYDLGKVLNRMGR